MRHRVVGFRPCVLPSGDARDAHLAIAIREMAEPSDARNLKKFDAVPAELKRRAVLPNVGVLLYPHQDKTNPFSRVA